MHVVSLKGLAMSSSRVEDKEGAQKGWWMRGGTGCAQRIISLVTSWILRGLGNIQLFGCTGSLRDAQQPWIETPGSVDGYPAALAPGKYLSRMKNASISSDTEMKSMFLSSL